MCMPVCGRGGGAAGGLNSNVCLIVLILLDSNRLNKIASYSATGFKNNQLQKIIEY